MLTKLLSLLISRARGIPFRFDPDLPATHLTSLVTSYAIRWLRGLALFPLRQGRVFVAGGCSISGRSKIRFQGPIYIGPSCVVNAVSQWGVQLGRNVSLQRQVVIECTGSLQKLGRGVVIGSNTGIGSFTFLGGAGGIRIGDNTIIGNFVSFHSENHIFDDLSIPIREQGTTWQGIEVGEDCWIGAKVILLDGARIGSQSVVAAGAVVRAGTYPPRSILAGVPAKVVGNRGERKAREAELGAPQDRSRSTTSRTPSEKA